MGERERKEGEREAGREGARERERGRESGRGRDVEKEGKLALFAATPTVTVGRGV